MRRVVILAFCSLFPWTAFSQTPDQALNNFRTGVLKNRFAVQGFSADAVTNFTWTANGLLIAPPKLKTIGVISVDSVKLRKDIIELTGKRSTLFKNKDGNLSLAGESRVTIKIALAGADPAKVLAGLKWQLFFPTYDAALAAIPTIYSSLLPASDQPLPKVSAPSFPKVCAAPAQLKAPHLMHAEEPSFSDEARSKHFSGEVTIVFTIDERGRPVDPWLAKPVGLGLDEAAENAVASYVFRPAMCDDVPIKVQIGVDVNFNAN